MLSDDTRATASVRVTLSMYENQAFCNSRVLMEDKPTKQGLTFGAAEYKSLRIASSFDQETQIGKEAYTEILSGKLLELKSQACYACAVSKPSQSEHECLLNAIPVMINAIVKNPAVNCYDLLEASVKKSRDCHCRITKLACIFDMLNSIHRAEIERNIRVSYDEQWRMCFKRVRVSNQ